MTPNLKDADTFLATFSWSFPMFDFLYFFANCWLSLALSWLPFRHLWLTFAQPGGPFPRFRFMSYIIAVDNLDTYSRISYAIL
jgi:hypothetical protein